MVPRFDNSNIPLSHFLEGCNEAKEMVGEAAEPALTRLMRSKIDGEARSAIHGQSFNSIQELQDFLKQIYALMQTVHQLMGELGYEFQRDNESVISFYNRIRDIGTRIVEAERVRTGEVSQEFKNSTANSVVDCFKKGLKMEVEQRLPENVEIQDLVKHAIRIEKEFQAHNALRRINNRGPLHVNLKVPLKREVFVCQLCHEEGHEGNTCPRNRTCTYCHKTGHTEDRCHFKRNQQTTCQLCNKLNHTALNCPTISKCQVCNKIGHTAKNCEQIVTQRVRCQICQNYGHSALECMKVEDTTPRENTQPNKPTLTCQYCEKMGHDASSCWSNPANVNKNACKICKNPNHQTENCSRKRQMNENWRAGNDRGAPQMSAKVEAPMSQGRSTNVVMFDQEILDLLPSIEEM